MTDSGSFDSGDLIHAADQNALAALINAKCAEAGVEGVGGWTALTTSAVYAVNSNTLVAAYQRAWDASANKPGTRQSSVAQGGLIYGSLYQNMWTQLGQMVFETFDYAPDANTFSCNFRNATAGGNETGQGGGLSGSDLILTQVGTVPGATGSPLGRLLTTGQWFTGTPALSSILRSATWSVILKVRDFTESVEGSMFRVCSAYNDDAYCAMGVYGSGNTVYGRVAASLFSTTMLNPPHSGDLWFFMYADGTNKARCGFSASQPTSWSAIPSGQKAEHASSYGDLSGVAYPTVNSCVGTYNEVTNSAFQCDMTVEYITLSRTALIGA